MYKLSHLDAKLCQLFRWYDCNFEHESCGYYSIWKLNFYTKWQTLKVGLKRSKFSQPEWFPVAYWLVLVISIMGTLKCLYDLISLYRSQNAKIAMWRKRKYYVVSASVLRKCRLITLLIMLNAWLLLCYGVVNVYPAYMTPWLGITTILLTCELCTWILEIFVGTLRFELQTVLSFLLYASNLMLVYSVCNAFQAAIEMQEEDNLRLLKRYAAGGGGA